MVFCCPNTHRAQDAGDRRRCLEVFLLFPFFWLPYGFIMCVLRGARQARARYGSRAAGWAACAPDGDARRVLFLEIEQNTKTSHDRRQRHGDKVKEQSRVVTARVGQYKIRANKINK